MSRIDIHQHITDQIISMMEEGSGAYRCPWRPAVSAARPVNVATGKAYRGVNVLALWAAAAADGYSSGVWGTYRQWSALGAQVRKGEKAAYIVFWKELLGQTSDGDEGAPGQVQEPTRRLVARASAVFAAEQVDGYVPNSQPPADPVFALGAADAFIAATRATIIHEGDRAFYRPSRDTIHMPPAERFIGTSTISPTQAYYATLLHELVHWTGHANRAARDLGGRFGAQAYAMEELVAELGAAFLCADLSISNAPRPDHAHYLQSWLSVLRQDKKAIFTAASKASQATAFLFDLQEGPSDAETVGELLASSKDNQPDALLSPATQSSAIDCGP